MIPNNLIRAASFTPNSLQSPNAWVGHMPFAAWVIQEVSPKIFVELGTHTGNSYFSFCQSVVEAGISSKCFAVDTWQGDDHAGLYNEEIFAKVNAHNQEHYAGFSQLLRMTFDDAVTYFANESIDLLHIDGLHTYEAVRHDFETWLPKLAPGAVVMFHDTNVRERNFGVWKLWKELQERYPNNLEFVQSYGLGVLQLNNVADDKRLEWLQLSLPEKQRLINYFAALGSRQLERFELTELKQHAVNLNHAVAERDGQVAALNHAVAERDGQVAALNHAVAERDGQVAALNHAVAERDGQVAALNHAVAQRDEQIANLNQAITERDRQIATIYSSLGWKLVTRYRRLLERVCPSYTRRRRFYDLCLKGGHIVRREGWLTFIRKGADYLSARVIGRHTLPDRSSVSLVVRAFKASKKPAPLLSVVIYARNGDLNDEYTRHQVEALRKQTIDNWELIVLANDRRFLHVESSSSKEEMGYIGDGPMSVCRGTYLYSPLDLAEIPSNWLEVNLLCLEAQALLITCNSISGYSAERVAYRKASISEARRDLIFYHRDIASPVDCALMPESLFDHRYCTEQKAVGRILRWHGLKGTEEMSTFPIAEIFNRFGKNVSERQSFLVDGALKNDVYVDVFPVDCLIDPRPVESKKPVLLIHMAVLAVGGAEKLTLDTLRNLKEKFSFVIVTSEPHSENIGSTHSMFRDLGTVIYDLGEYAVPPVQFSMMSYLIKKYNPAALFVANGSSFFYDHLLNLRRNFPELRIVNQVFDHRAGWIGRYNQDVIDAVDIHIACNRNIQKTYIEQYGVPETKVAFIEHGIDFTEFEVLNGEEKRKRLRVQFGIPQEKVVISFIARLHPQKRPHDFLKLAKRFETDDRFYFLMVGDGPLRQNIDDFINLYHLKNLKKLGFYKPITDILIASDILVVTSEYEGLPLVVLNALAMSVAVVSTNVGSIAEVLERDGSGIIVHEIGNIDKFATALNQAVEKLDDLRTKGPKTVLEAYDIRQKALKYEHAFFARNNIS